MATFQAVGADVPVSIVPMGYLIGQLGGLLPLPGGIDGGLIGTLVVYGAPASAVLAYRIILFWLPLVGGAIAFATPRTRPLRADPGVLTTADRAPAGPLKCVEQNAQNERNRLVRP